MGTVGAGMVPTGGGGIFQRDGSLSPLETKRKMAGQYGGVNFSAMAHGTDAGQDKVD